MWKIVKTIIYLFFGLFVIFILHTYVSNLPLPFNFINIIILYLSWEYIYKKNEWSIVLVFGLGFLLELFSSLPFGTSLFVTISTLVFIRLIFNYIFSDFNGIIVFFLGSLAPITNDGITYVSMNLNIIIRGEALLPFYNLQDIVMKIFLNGFILLIAYGIHRLFTKSEIKKLRPLDV